MKTRSARIPPAVRLLPPAALLTAVFVLAAQAFLRNLHHLLSFDETFAAIFVQISGAPMRTPLLPVLLLAWGASVLTGRGWRRGRACRAAAGILAVPGGLLIWLAALMMTSVNGVMFLDVVRTLAPALMSGAI